MPRKPGNLVRHELIGLEAEVVESTDPGREGIQGEVDETRETLEIGSRTVPKDGSVFRFRLEDEQVRVEGGLLVGRPEERILKKFPRKWEYTD